MNFSLETYWLRQLLMLASIFICHTIADIPDDVSSESDDGENSLDVTTLRLVHVLFRHGDRSQITPYNKDIYDETDWPQGYGQLSTHGMRQAYDLGEFFRESYVETGFLNASYKRNEIYVRSTTIDRALMTAYSVLSGLYPPTGDQLWSEDVPSWQPIPVHTVAYEDDTLLLTGDNCPTYNAAREEFMKNNVIVNETMTKYKELYAYMSVNSGEEDSWDGIRHVLDPIFCQEMNHYTLPEWVHSDVFDKIVELRDAYASVEFPPDVAYLKGGQLVGEVMNHMQNRSSRGSLTEKMFMYSAHDSTLDMFMTTLGVFNNKQPPYTACVILELHEQTPGNFVVLMSYRNESDQDPYPLKLQHCDTVCPLDDFAKIMKSSIPLDLPAECGITTTVTSSISPSTAVTAAVAVLMSVMLLFLVAGAMLCFVKRRKLLDNHDYFPVPIEMN